MAVGLDVCEESLEGVPLGGVCVVVAGAGAAVVGDGESEDGFAGIFYSHEVGDGIWEGVAEGICADVEDGVVDDVAGAFAAEALCSFGVSGADSDFIEVLEVGGEEVNPCVALGGGVAGGWKAAGVFAGVGEDG